MPGTISANRSLTPRQTGALTALAGPVEGGIESFIREKVTQVVQSLQFAALWKQANTLAHAQIDAALSGETTGAVQIQGLSDMGDVMPTWVWILFAILWIALAFWPARVAGRKGHRVIGYFILSLVFFPLSLILAYRVEDRSGASVAQGR